MTTMIHEFELKHENHCTTDTTKYWNICFKNEHTSANVQTFDSDELVKICDKMKAKGYELEVTEVQIMTTQMAVTDYFGHKF